MAGLAASPSNESIKKSPLEQQMNEIDRALSNLGETIASLQNRLSPISIMRSPGGTERVVQPIVQPKAPLSMIANGMREFKGRIDQLNNVIHEIMSDLEI